jgi:hypothetical protein
LKYIRASLAGILSLIVVTAAVAQTFPNVASQTVIGRLGVPGQTGPSQAIPFATLLSKLGGAPSANTVWAGPTSGSVAPPTFRALVGADLPAPGASSRGGVQSLTCSTSNWFNALSTGGAFGCSQPNFTDLAGSIAAGQIPAGTIVNAAISASAAIAGSKVTTVSNSVAGVVPALPNDGTKFFNGLGVYAAPPSAGTHILLATLTASASTSLNDSVACGGSNCLTATYSAYEIIFQNVLPTTNSVTCEIQVHSGGTYQATAYLANELHFNGGAVASNAITTYIPCSSATAASNAGTGISGAIHIFNPSQTASPKSLVGNFSYSITSNTINSGAMSVGYWNGGNGAVDGFQVLFSSGNITSGVIKIYGIQ